MDRIHTPPPGHHPGDSDPDPDEALRRAQGRPVVNR